MSVLKPKLIVQAGAQLDDWGTPPEVLDFVRLACGGPITLDLASNEKANKLVQAKRYFSLRNKCPDAPPMHPGEVVWCNPPGPVAEVRRFWAIWLGCMQHRHDAQGGFLIFNLDHLRALSQPPPSLPRYEVVFWRRRLRFVGAPSQYNHPSGLVLKTPRRVGGDCGPVMEWA